MHSFIISMSYFVNNDSEHRLTCQIESVVEPVAEDHINGYHQLSLWITERSALSKT